MTDYLEIFSILLNASFGPHVNLLTDSRSATQQNDPFLVSSPSFLYMQHLSFSLKVQRKGETPCTPATLPGPKGCFVYKFELSVCQETET